VSDRPADTYTHGHHASVLGMHATRTAQDSAAYLLGYLRPGQDLLDVGCGPGTITVGLAEATRGGRCVGIDVSEAVIAQAAAHAGEVGRPETTFAVGDAYALDFPDHSFDVVHAHQVLQHLTDPVRALREMLRVLRPGGIVAVRDADYRSMIWAPRLAELDRWMELYQAVARRNRAEPDAARFVGRWVREAGFVDRAVTMSAQGYADAAGRRFWGGGWAGRARQSAFATQAVDYGLSSTDELERIGAAWERWAADEDGFFAFVHGEVVARRPA
jgi:ubiquinone/menaquinone biosynthesis C-methylase UbiE